MNTWDEPAGSERDRGRARRNAGYAAARQLARAVAERERGRRRLNATTITVSFASVVAAGIVVAVLPGSTHASVNSTSGASTSGSSSDSSNSSNSSNSNSGTLQQPASSPQSVSGGGGSTSGGT